MKIKEMRSIRKMSQKELAISVGVTQGAVSSWERGDTFPSTENLVKIARVLSCSVEDLTGESSHEAANEPHEKKPTQQGEQLDQSLIELLRSLDQQGIQRVRDFAAGVAASRKV